MVLKHFDIACFEALSFAHGGSRGTLGDFAPFHVLPLGKAAFRRPLVFPSLIPFHHLSFPVLELKSFQTR